MNCLILNEDNEVTLEDTCEQMQLKTELFIHQSGINGFAVQELKLISNTDNKSIYTTTLASGGDDNMIAITSIHITTNNGSLIEVKAKQICEVNGHSAQIMGKLSFSVYSYYCCCF